MRTFAELLTEYTRRTGVSDAELARAVGVQRQTIFRWKEGLVARPRSADDVLHLASKLRLTPAERDELLMAAGFPPLNPPPADERPVATPVSLPVEPVLPSASTVVVSLPRKRRLRSIRIWAALAGGIVLVVALAVLAFEWPGWARYPRARAGETLIVIGQFANYAGGAQGYNVAGRLREALERELTADRLSEVRAATWPDVIPDASAAESVARRAGAPLVIWGEYDSGRVLAHFTVPGAGQEAGGREVEKLAASPAELSTTINGQLPEEIRYLALLTVGQMYADRGAPARAGAILEQAAARPPADPSALARLYFLLGYVHQVDQPADLNGAIGYYGQALALRPEIIAAHNNRGLAYLRRGGPGDAANAVADLTEVIAALPEDATTLNNRGAAYLQIGGAENLTHAMADLDRAIALAPDAPEATFNRGLAHVRQDRREAWQADFDRVLALAPDHPGVQEALCWAYVLEGEAESALPYCDRAIAGDPGGPGRDSRGIAYAQLGRFADAIAEFEAYLDSLRQKDDERYSREEPRYNAWLDALRSGKNPFDRATLDQLRHEP